MTAAEIKQLRTSLSLSREEFAVSLGVSLRTVARWEADDSRPTRLALRALERLSRKRPAK